MNIHLVKGLLGFFLQPQVDYLLVSMFFGVLVGAAEVVSRYRDEPFLAILSKPGLCYLTLNALFSGAAYGLLVNYKQVYPSVGNDLLLASIVSGFGAMVVMRSKLFSFRTEAGEEYAIGPDAVLSIFLRSVDRSIDRGRSSRRQNLVYDEVRRIKDPSKASDFLRVSLASYQNLSVAEKTELNQVILKIEAENLSPQLKLMAMGFGFLNIGGEKNFRELIRQLRNYLDNPPESTGLPDEK